MVKHRFDQGTIASLFWEHLTVTDGPMTMVLRSRASGAGLAIQGLLLDTVNSGQVLFDRTVVDTPASDPVSAAPAPLEGSEDPGPAWQGTGAISLSLFGANTNLTQLEMDMDNFGMRQTREVTENDFIPLVYTNAQRQTLAYRLFVPAQLEPEALNRAIFRKSPADAMEATGLNMFAPPLYSMVPASAWIRPASQRHVTGQGRPRGRLRSSR